MAGLWNKKYDAWPKNKTGKIGADLMKSIKLSDLSLRDGFQSLFGGRGRTPDMVLIAGLLEEIGYESVEVWGGASFDIMHRYLNEDPWERIRELGRHFKKTPMSMVIRGKNLVGYQPYSEDVIKAFIERAASNGIKKVRVFDNLNDLSSLKTISEKIKSANLTLEIAVSYSLSGKNSLKNEKIYTKKYYLEKVRHAEDLGAEIICLKDILGILTPYDCYDLVCEMKNTTSLPIAIHSHSSSGMAPMTHLKACEAGADIIDTCLSPFAYRNSHPAGEPLAAALAGTEMDTGLDLEKMAEASKFAEKEIIPKYRAYLNEEKVSVIDTDLLINKISGITISNILNQLKESKTNKESREVVDNFISVRRDLGNIPIVSHTSQILSTQTINNILFDEKDGEYRLITDQVKKLVKGKYGKAPSEFGETLKRKVDENYFESSDDASDTIGLNQAGKNLKGLAADVEDELIYSLFPKTGKRFLKWKYGKEEPPKETRPVSFETAKKRFEEIQSLKQGKTGEEEICEIPEKGPGTRSFNVYVGDEFFEVSVDPGEEFFLGPQASVSEEKIREYIETGKASVEKKSVKKEPLVELVREEKAPGKKRPGKEDPDFFFLKAPMPGSIVSLRKKSGDRVKKGDIVLVLEAMKMENPLSSPIDGVIKEVRCSGGDQVPKDSVLCVIDCSIS